MTKAQGYFAIAGILAIAGNTNSSSVAATLFYVSGFILLIVAYRLFLKEP